MFTKIIRKLSYFHYNIGFFSFSEDILYRQPEIKWMAHSYRDRFFADPFIMDVDDNKIEVLVEEFIYSKWKGCITLLTIDKYSYNLLRRKVLLDLKTHLSFPCIFRENDRVFVAPENSQSGGLHIYEYDSDLQKLTFVKTLVNLPLVDSVLCRNRDKYHILGSIKNGNENGELYIWTSATLFGEYVPQNGFLVKKGLESSRRAGSFFSLDDNLYSTSQSCVSRYGENLNINRIKIVSDKEIDEERICIYYPQSSYPEGLHTFNMYKNLCVVDGLTYLFRPLQKLKTLFFRFQNNNSL